jgi:hypothetical protein
MLILAILAAILVLFVLFMAYTAHKMRSGHLIGVHVVKFEDVYDRALKAHGSRKDALREALLVLRTCPKLKELGDNDVKRIVDLVGELPDPKKIITAIIMEMDSSRALAALRDEKFLGDVAVLYNKQSKDPSA